MFFSSSRLILIKKKNQHANSQQKRQYLAVFISTFYNISRYKSQQTLEPTLCMLFVPQPRTSGNYCERFFCCCFFQCSSGLSIIKQSSTGLFSLLHEIKGIREFSLMTGKKILKFEHLDYYFNNKKNQTMQHFIHKPFLCCAKLFKSQNQAVRACGADFCLMVQYKNKVIYTTIIMFQLFSVVQINKHNQLILFDHIDHRGFAGKQRSGEPRCLKEIHNNIKIIECIL